MKRTLLTGLALAAGLAAFGGAANAASITPGIAPAMPLTAVSAMPLAVSEGSPVVKVGMRFKRKSSRRHRTGMHRSRPNRARRYGFGRRHRRTGMWVNPGIVTILRYCKRQELLPGGDPRCP